MKDEDLFVVKRLTDWEDLKTTLLDLEPGFIFRGQTKARWDIKTTIERKSGNHKSFAENHMFNEFKKNIHNYDLNRVPKSELEILLLLQHFGAPTRLIDFTESIYVASFFSLNTEHEGESSIYAIDSSSLYSRFNSFNDHKHFDLLKNFHAEKDYPIVSLSDHKLFSKLILNSQNRLNLIGIVDPTYHHERSNPQHSLHITIGNINESFLKNFDYFLKHSSSELDLEESFIKFTFPNSIREEALYDLNQMNINYASLFPDFNGYIRNLYLDYECDRSIGKKSMRKAFEQT